MKKGMFIHIKHLGLALVIAMCTLTSCSDIESMFASLLFPSKESVNPPYVSFREFVNNTNKDLRVEYRRYYLSKYETLYSYEMPAGDSIQTHYCESYSTREKVEELKTTRIPGWGKSLECVFYDAQSGDILYLMDFFKLTDPSLWTERWQEDPIPGDYLLSYFNGYDFSTVDYHDDWYTFIYWTFTLTDEHLAEYAAGKNQ